MPGFEIDQEKLQMARAAAVQRTIAQDPALRYVLGPAAVVIAAATTFSVWLAVHALLWAISPALAIILGIFLTPLFIVAGIAIPGSR